MASRRDMIKKKIDDMVGKAESYAREKGKAIRIAKQARRSLLRELLVRDDAQHDALLAKTLSALNKLTDRTKNTNGFPAFSFEFFKDSDPTTRH